MGQQFGGSSKRFLEIYNSLDRYMRQQLKKSFNVGHNDLLTEMANRNPIFRNRHHDLQTFAHLRNAIVHNPYGPAAEPIAEPHQRIVALYEGLLQQVLNPPAAITIAVPASKVFTAKWTDRVIDVIRTMNRQVYTHVPIMSGGSVEGVFSENTVFSYLAHHGEAILDSSTPMSEFQEFAPLRKHASEEFVFVGRTEQLAEVSERFQLHLKTKKRLAVVFITATGKASESLLGLITAWDIAGAPTA